MATVRVALEADSGFLSIFDEEAEMHAPDIVPASLALNLSFLHTPPWETEPWQTILENNNPGGTPTNAPLLIIQGDADPIVAPDVHPVPRSPASVVVGYVAPGRPRASPGRARGR